MYLHKKGSLNRGDFDGNCLSKQEWRGVYFGLIGLFIYFIPYLYLGQDSVWPTSDYLDLVVAWYKVLIEQDAVFRPNDWMVSGLLDQLPRGVLASEFYLKTWLFYFLQPFSAILVNKLLIHFSAFFSMYHFLLHFGRKKKRSLDVWLYSLVWSTFSFWPESGIAVATLPTVYLVFFRLHHGEKFRFVYWVFIFIYTAYTLLHLQGIFVGTGLFIVGVTQWISTRKINRSYWAGFLSFTLLSCLFNYRHFLIFFFSQGGFVPHRIEYDIYSFGGFYDEFWVNFLNILAYGQFHSVRFSPFLFPFSALILFCLRLETRKMDKDLSFAFQFIFLYLGVTALAVLTRYIPLVEWLGLSFVRVFSYDRFLVLFFPVLFYSFVLAMDYLRDFWKWGRIIQLMMVFAVLGFSVLILDDNHKNVILKPLTGLGERVPTYREFYGEKQFEEIKSELLSSGFPEGKVVSIGLHPAVATFNGLHSLDGYTGNYPLAHKHSFSGIILPEIQKEGKESWLYKHFMGWGNKCYMFNMDHQDQFLRSKWQIPQALDRPSYDWKQFKKMGGMFVLSTDPIHNSPELSLLNVFDHDESAWKIHLYKVF